MKPINSLHYIYWIIILVLVNIALFSYYYSGNDNLTSMIAFAATIASIILSVLAIFMSILSNNSIGGMLHKVRDIHDAVATIPDTLNETVSDLKRTTSGLKDVNTDVNNSITALDNKLQGIEEHLAQNDNRLNELFNKFSSANSTSISNSEEPSEKLIEQYLNTISLNGLLLLYGIQLYQERKKVGVFSLDSFVKVLSGVESIYLLGILVASTSANILSFEQVNQNNNMEIKNMSLSPFINKENLSDHINIICTKIREKFGESLEYYDAISIENKISEYVESID